VLAALGKCGEWLQGASEREVRERVEQGLEEGGRGGPGAKGDALSRLGVTAKMFSFNFGLGASSNTDSNTENTDADAATKPPPPLLTPQKASLCTLETLLTLEETQLAVRFRRHKKQILHSLLREISDEVTGCPLGPTGGLPGVCELQYVASVVEGHKGGGGGRGRGAAGGQGRSARRGQGAVRTRWRRRAGGSGGGQRSRGGS